MGRAIEALAAASVERTKAGARHVLKVPAVRALAMDSRLVEIARQFVGGRHRSCSERHCSTSRRRPTGWSSGIKIRRCLSVIDSTVRVGDPGRQKPVCSMPMRQRGRSSRSSRFASASMTRRRRMALLRVLPNTHGAGVLTDEQIAQLARAATPVDCVTSSGGIVAMRPLTIHASSKSHYTESRRVLHIGAAAVTLGAGAELAVG